MKILHIQKVAGIAGSENHLLTLLPALKENGFEQCSSKDSLEHFSQPWVVIGEVHRVLKDGGQFIIWVPFMHPFHRDDFYRYSPLGLEHLLSDFEIISFESPLWVFTVVGTALIEALKRVHLGFMERPIKQSCEWLDRRFTRRIFKKDNTETVRSPKEF